MNQKNHLYQMYQNYQMNPKYLKNHLYQMNQVHFHGSVTQPTVAAYREGGVFLLASRETADGDRDGIPIPWPRP